MNLEKVFLCLSIFLSIIFSLGYFGVIRGMHRYRIISIISTFCTAILGMMMLFQLMLTKRLKPVGDFYDPNYPISNFGKTAPNVLLAYSLHPSFCTLYKSLKEQNNDNAWTITSYSYGYAGFVYAIIMTTSLLLFGDEIKNNMLITLSLSKDDSFEYAGTMLFITMAVLHTPLIFFIGKEAVLTIYCELRYETLSKDRELTSDSEDYKSDQIFTKYIKKDANISNSLDWKEYYPITIILYIVIILTIYSIKDISKLFELVGSVGATLVSFILPPIFYWKLQDGNALLRDKLIAIVVLTYGIIMLGIGVYANILV